MRSATLRDGELERAAFHEAGHAVACYELGRTLRYATVILNEESLGRFLNAEFREMLRTNLDSSPATIRLVEREVLILLAGPEAERDALGPIGLGGDTGDLHDAASIASLLHEGQVQEKYLALMVDRCRAMVAKPAFRGGVRLVALALMDRSWLSEREIRQLCHQATQDAAPIGDSPDDSVG